MKTKTYLTLASAALLFAGCTAEDYLGDKSEQTSNGGGGITFNMQTAAQTREATGGSTTQSSGESAAKLLNNMFIVWGEKNESTTDNSNAATTETNTVFKNYKVEYSSGSENTSTTNTKGWEYVGKTPYASSVVSPSLITNDNNTNNSPFVQTVKYWDDQATSYTFTAISAKPSDLSAENNNNSNPKVVIKKITGSSETNGTITSANKGYTVELKSGASVGDIYFSDRKYIAKSNGYSHEAVQMAFRNFMSKIRFGVYETVSGYKVVITGIKFGSNSETEHTSTSSEDGGKTFGINGNFIVAGSTTGDNATTTTYTVTYDSNNKAVATLNTGAVTADNLNTEGTNWLSTSSTSPVGTSSTNPTYDKSVTNDGSTTTGVYTSILPNPSNTTGLTLKVAYKLISEDTGEEIVFKDNNSEIYRTVTVPAEYCQWKSNYAYTYLFKISDKSADLYPITFDAVVETEEMGNQETITGVTEPSISTFATSTTDSKTTIVSGKNEYEAGNTIYAVVSNTASGATSDYVTLSVDESSTNIKLYTVTATDGFPITEAAVAQALSDNTATTGKKLTVTAVTISKENSNDTDIKAQLTSTVPAEDGGTRSISALKWTPSAAGIYAIEYSYTPTGESTTKNVYKIVNVAAASSTDGNGGGAKLHN